MTAASLANLAALTVAAVDERVGRRDTAAIEEMLRALAHLDWDDEVHARIVERLPDFGGSLIQPALAAIATLATTDLELRDLYCSLLARLSERDDRIFEAICEVWERDRPFGAQLFVDYGDPRALPLIERALLAFEGDAADTIDALKYATLRSAFRSLGGQPGNDAGRATETARSTPAMSHRARERRSRSA
jgi:hypothetical protein